MLKNSKDKSDSKIIKYFALSNYDINDIKKNLICFNNVVLSMIRNAVVVLPNDRKNNGVQNINNLYNIKKNINDFYYEEFVDTKKVFLSCIKDKIKRHVFDNAISRLIFDDNVSLYLFVYPFFDTSIKTKIEHKIDSNTRATILSLASLFVSLFAIILNSIIGVVSEQSGYFASPICVFVIILLVLCVIRNITMFYRIDLAIRRFLAKLVSK